MAKTHVAVYGSTRILRGYCPNCKSWALIVKNEYQCCDSKVNQNNRLHGQKRMIECDQKRKRPSKYAIRKMLDRQNNKCIYCDIPFDTAYKHPKKNKIMRTKVCCDHFIPFAYSQNNKDINFVCTCGTCNGIKSDLMFNTIEEAKSYVEYRRAKKGYTKEIYVL